MTEKDRINEALFNPTKYYRSLRNYSRYIECSEYPTEFIEFSVGETAEIPYIALRENINKLWKYENAIYVCPLTIGTAINCTTTNPVWTVLGGLNDGESTIAKVVFKDVTYYIGDNIILDENFDIMYVKSLILKRVVYESSNMVQYVPKKAMYRISKKVIGKNDPLSKQIINKLLPAMAEHITVEHCAYDSRISRYSVVRRITVPSEILINDIPWSIKRTAEPDKLLPEMKEQLAAQLHSSELRFFNGLSNFALDDNVL